MINYNVISDPIGSVPNLAAALDLQVKDIREVLCIPPNDKYELKHQPKADGSERKVYKPHHKVRRVQRKINKRIFSLPSVIQWPSYIYGSIPNSVNSQGEETRKDYVSCAEVHCGAKSVLRVDVKDFFENIHFDVVEKIFSELFNYPEEVADVLARLCIHENRLPQGGLTSGYLACLCLHDLEPELVRRLGNKGLKYTRFVDDITISSKSSLYDFSFAKKLVVDMLHSKDLPVNEEKTSVQRMSTDPIMVHGLRVMYKEPRLPSDEVRKIRAAVRNIEKVAANPGYRLTNAYKRDFNKCMGRVNKLARVKHKQHRTFINRLSKIKPLPSKEAVIRAKSMIRRLEKDYPGKSGSYWYKKKYYQAHERLNVIKRSYPTVSEILREKLKGIKPEYE